VEDSFLQPHQHNYLLAVHATAVPDRLALAWADLSTGEIHTALSSRAPAPLRLVCVLTAVGEQWTRCRRIWRD
jgi:DNA mismatch repair ATPase MutS